MGFEPRISGYTAQHPNHSATEEYEKTGYTAQHPNHSATEEYEKTVSHYKYDIGYRCKVL